MEGRSNDRETALKFYEMARAELVARMAQLDTIMIAYLGGVAAIFGVVITSQDKLHILLLVPLLSLAAALMSRQHSTVIGAIASYCVAELEPHLQAGSLAQWDSSKALKDCYKPLVDLRSYTQFLLIVVPAVVTLVTLHSNFWWGHWWQIGAWWFGAFSTVICVFNLALLRRHRRRMFWNAFQSRERSLNPK